MLRVRVDRLKAIAEHLESGQLIHKTFNDKVTNGVEPDEGGCRFYYEKRLGPVGDATGEFPFLFPKDWKFGDWSIVRVSGSGKENAAAYLGLSTTEFLKLFQATRPSSTRYDVAKRVRDFITSTT